MSATILQVADVLDKTNGYAIKLRDLAFLYVPRIVGALIIYAAGSWVISRMSRFVHAVMMKRRYDASLQTFLSSMIRIALLVLLLISILSVLGMDVGIFSALLVGVGIAIGGALNGSLGNFAGGVMLLIFKPFKVGDKIMAQEETGTVIELGIFNTLLLATDHRTIILPNGPLSTQTIINYSAHGDLRVETLLQIADTENIDNARTVAMNAILAHPAVLKEPAPEINVFKVSDGMITLAVRPYASQKDYWKVYFGAQEAVKKAWDAAGIQSAAPVIINLNKTIV
jgi:small conductance mechanosensitive channel